MDLDCVYVSSLMFAAVTNGKLIISSWLRELLHLAMLTTSTIINYTVTARREEKVVGADLAIRIFAPLWVMTLSELHTSGIDSSTVDLIASGQSTPPS
jgi:hypothetical protein